MYVHAQVEEILVLDEVNALQPSIQFSFNDHIYFGSSQPRGLWMTDGTADGTRKIFDGQSVHKSFLREGRFFVSSTNQLYEIMADGSSPQLVAVATDWIREVLLLNDTFIILSGSNQWYEPSYIQRFHPGETGTEMVFQSENRTSHITPLNEGFLFSTFQKELYFSDGTAEGTILLADPETAEVDLNSLSNGTAFQGYFLFTMSTEEHGSEPWITDGTAEGTRLLKDISPGFQTDGFPHSSRISSAFLLNDEVYFICWAEGSGLSLFKTDGTTENTDFLFSLKEAINFLSIEHVFTFQGEIYLEAVTLAHGYELWKTDGTLSGTRLVKDIWPGSAGSTELSGIRRSTTLTENHIFFNANNGEHGYELWRSNGTEAGTGMVFDLSPGAGWSHLSLLGSLGEHFYFMDAKGGHPNQYRLKRVHHSSALHEGTDYPKSYDWFTTIGYPYTPTISFEYLLNEGLEVDREGNVYVSGEFRDTYLQFYGSESFLQKAASPEGYKRNFLASYDKNGQFRWAREVGGNSDFKEQVLAIDPENNVICAGDYKRQGMLGTVVMDDPDRRFYLAKFDSEGTLLWKRQAEIGTAGRPEVYTITTDEAGNIYVGGSFTGFSARFGPFSIEANHSPAYFAAKYDKDGNVLWLKHLPHPSLQYHGHINAMQAYNGKLYVIISSGGFNTSVDGGSCQPFAVDIQLYALNTDGVIIEDERFTSDYYSFVSNAKFSPEGYLHLVGQFRGELNIDNLKMYARCDNPQGFVLKLDQELQLIDVWAMSPNTAAYDIDFGPNSTYYLSGRAPSNSALQPNFSLASDQQEITFVAKYDKFDRLIDLRAFNVGSSLNFSRRPLIAVDNEEKILLSERYSTAFDTLPVGGGNGMNIGLLKFSLDAQPQYPQDDRIEQADFHLFPNPARQALFLSAPDEDFRQARFNIYDSSGRFISSPRVFYDIGVTRLDVSDLPAGLYFLEVDSGARRFSERFVKVE